MSDVAHENRIKHAQGAPRTEESDNEPSTISLHTAHPVRVCCLFSRVRSCFLLLASRSLA